MPFQIDPVLLIEPHPFLFQKRLLPLIAPAFGKADKPLGIDHPVPGETVLAAHGVEDSGDLPRAVGMTGHQSDAPIGADLAGGDAFDDLDDRLGKGFHFYTRWPHTPLKTCARGPKGPIQSKARILFFKGPCPLSNL